MTPPWKCPVYAEDFGKRFTRRDTSTRERKRVRSRTVSIRFRTFERSNVKKLEPSIAKLIRKAIDSLAVNPAKGKPLAYELAGLRSLRTSDYRIMYRVKEQDLLMIVIAGGLRSEIYKKLKELLSSLSS